MHRFAHAIIAAERKREVGYAARNMREGQRLADARHRIDIGAPVIIVLLDSRRDSENIGIEDDVLGWKADAVDQYVIGPAANLEFALRRIGLALFVERHDDHRRAITAGLFGGCGEKLLPLLQTGRT